MSAIPLLTIDETIAAATAARGRANREPFDPRRALDGLSMTAIISMSELVPQLDTIAQVAARAVPAMRPDDYRLMDPVAAAAAADELIRLLTAAAYLPLPATPEPEEATDGQA